MHSKIGFFVRSVLIAVVVQSGTVAAMAQTPATSVSQVTAHGMTVQLKLRGNDNLCLQPQAESVQTGARLELRICDYQDAQQYAVVATGASNFALRNVRSGLCLDLPVGSTIVQQFACHGGANQAFTLTAPRGVTSAQQQSRAHGFNLRSVHNQTFVADDGRDIVQGDNAFALELDLDVSRFAIRSTSGSTVWYSSRPLSLRGPLDTTRCLDAPIVWTYGRPSPLTESPAGSMAQVTTRCQDDPNHVWTLASLGTGELEVRATYSLCLDLPPVTGIVNAQTYACHHGPNQRFRMRYLGGDQVDLRSSTGRCVGLAATGQDSRVQAGDCATHYSVWRIGPEYELPAAPQLTSPAAGATVATFPNFSWEAAAWAQSYLLCAARSGVACPSREVPAGSDPNVIVVKTTSTSVGRLGGAILGPNVAIDLMQFADQDVNWSVAACRGYTQPTDCSYQRNVRPIHVEPHWNTHVSLDTLQIHDDCDNVSDGEWQLAMGLGNGRNATSSFWKNNSVVAGTRQRVFSNTLSKMLAKDRLTIALGGRECDSNGVWNLLEVFRGVEGIVNVMQNSIQSCGAEELQEMSGDNDSLGTVQIILDPAQWKNNVPVQFTLVAPTGQSCSAVSAYTATFSIQGVRQ
jgi:hypothetical protein